MLIDDPAESKQTASNIDLLGERGSIDLWAGGGATARRCRGRREGASLEGRGAPRISLVLKYAQVALSADGRR